MHDIVFVDIETTGLDLDVHEIIDVAAIRVDGMTLDPLATFASRVAPAHIHTASPEALEVNGYAEERWKHAPSIVTVLERLGPTLDGAIVAGHNVGFDWSFLTRAYRDTGVPFPVVDYHRIDTASLAWPLLASGFIASLSLGSVCQWFGIARDRPHSALCDAQCALDVARRILPGAQLGHRLARVTSDEVRIVHAFLGSLESVRAHYGRGLVLSGRNYPGESLEKVLDALTLCAAELVRLGRGRAVPALAGDEVLR